MAGYIGSRVSNSLVTLDGVTIGSATKLEPFIGSIAPFAMSSAPSGWLVCNGAEYAIASYGDLYSAIGTTWGALTDGSGSSGSTHFLVPDFRGEFLRGFDNGLGSDPDAASRTGGDAVGSSQGNMVKNHVHWLESWAAYSGTGPANPRNQGYGSSGPYGNSIYSRDISDDSGVNNKNFAGGNETRPRNVYVQYCIKF